jgi:TonB family protein
MTTIVFKALLLFSTAVGGFFPQSNVKPPKLIQSEKVKIDQCDKLPDNLQLIVHLEIGVDGTPFNETISSSSGNACFDGQALAAAHNYRFSPATRDGKPVVVDIYITMTSLRD